MRQRYLTYRMNLKGDVSGLVGSRAASAKKMRASRLATHGRTPLVCRSHLTRIHIIWENQFCRNILTMVGASRLSSHCPPNRNLQLGAALQVIEQGKRSSLQ